MRWLTNFYDFSFKWTATAAIGIHPTKAWFSQLVNFKNFKLGKNATEMYRMLQTAFRPSCMNWASVFEWHKRFKESRKSVRDNERCRRSREVRTTKLGSHWTDSQQGILCWGFKGVQEEIPSEEASTLQIGSVAFPPSQCTSPQLHPCHRLFDQDGNQDSFSASL